MKRIVILLLVLLMIFPAAACARPDDSSDTSADSTLHGEPNETDTAEETTNPNEADDLGNPDFDSAIFNILTRKSTSYEIKSDEITGDLVPDAVYDRNVTIEDRFGVKFNIIELPGDWGDRDGFMAAVQNNIAAGLHDYDLVLTHSAYIVNIAAKGCGYDMSQLDNINFDKKWWCRKYVDNAALYGRYYTAMGDLCYTLYAYMSCVFFNKMLAESVDMPDLYELVQNGTWTLEKLKEFAFLVGQDLDGNGVYNERDLFGLGINNHFCRMTATFWDAKITVPGSDGKQMINLPNEKYYAIYEQLFDLVHNHKENVFFADEGSVIQTNMFINDQLLFFTETLRNAATMKDMQSEYGILPIPKYDEQQENYISSARDFMTAILVMANITRPEIVGTVTEALCMYGYRKITPAYYETTLKYKYLSDPVAMQMLDLIRDTMTFEFAAIYTNSIILIYSTLGTHVRDGTKSIAPLIKANSKIWQKSVDILYEDFAKINN